MYKLSKSKMTKEKYIENIKTIYGNDYELVSDFIDTQSKVTIKHNKCGNEFEIVANEFTRSRVHERFRKFCTKCSHLYIKKSKDTVNNELKLYSNGNIEIKSNFTGNNENCNLKCNRCGYIWIGTPRHTIKHLKKNSKNGCPRCSKKMKKNTSIFKEEVYNMYKNEYEVLGEYKTTNTPILMKHNICNKTYYIEPNQFLNKKTKCPHCNLKLIESKPVKLISEYLENNNIKYEKEFKIDGLRYKKPLRFDFCLFINNKILLIEYDGIQHFARNNFMMKEDLNYKEYLLRDIIKNEYCKINNLPLLRVNCFQDNETIILEIEKFIKEFKR